MYRSSYEIIYLSIFIYIYNNNISYIYTLGIHIAFWNPFFGKRNTRREIAGCLRRSKQGSWRCSLPRFLLGSGCRYKVLAFLRPPCATDAILVEGKSSGKVRRRCRQGFSIRVQGLGFKAEGLGFGISSRRSCLQGLFSGFCLIGWG